MSFNHRFSWILIQSLQVIVLSTPKSSCLHNWTLRTVCEKMSFKSFRNSDTGNELETRTSWTVTFRAMSRTLVHLLIIYKLFTSSLQDSSFALNQSSFDTEFGWNPVTFKLQSYDAEELVRCFEKMAVPSRKFLHFVFVGDSRVRQYFYSFVQVKYDYFNFNSLTRHKLRIQQQVALRFQMFLVNYWRNYLYNRLQSTRHFVEHFKSYRLM